MRNVKFVAMSIGALVLTACANTVDDTEEVSSEAAAPNTASADASLTENSEEALSEQSDELSPEDKARSEAYSAILKRDFARMMEWFAGEFDNQEQVYFNDNLNIPNEERHERVHHIFAPVDLPNFPGKTFYVEQYQNNDPADIYRQRVYSFEQDEAENAIRLTIYVPKDAASIVGAYKDLSRLDGLTPEAFTTYPGCEVYWRPGNGIFHGTMKENACRIESKRSERTLVITDDLQLSKNAIWIRDEAVDTDGNYVYGNKARIHHKSNRAQIFNCWAAPQKNDGEYGFVNNLTIHDQGGWIRIPKTDDYEAIALKMRNVIWPTGNNRPSRVLYAYRGGDEETAISYAWTSPDEPRLGINLRWVQVSCTQGDNTIKPGINLKTGSGK